MWRMRKFGHSSRLVALVCASTLAAGSLVPAIASAQVQIPTSSELSSRANIQLPDIQVPQQIVDSAARVGIHVPGRIELTPKPALSAAEQELTVATEKQLVREGHRKDAEAQVIAAQWAAQAARGEATFVGNVGRGTTATDRGTGQIYRLNPAQAADRIAFLNRDINVNPVKDPKRFGVATARNGETIYLAEFFLN